MTRAQFDGSPLTFVQSVTILAAAGGRGLGGGWQSEGLPSSNTPAYYLRGHNWELLSLGHSVLLYLEFRLRHLKKSDFFSIRIKELLKPNSFEGQKGGRCLLFLKAFS